MSSENEKIIRIQEALLKNYEKEIDGLEKENKRLIKMLDFQNEIIETQKQEIEVYERFMDKVHKAHEKTGPDRGAADAAEKSTTKKSMISSRAKYTRQSRKITRKQSEATRRP